MKLSPFLQGISQDPDEEGLSVNSSARFAASLLVSTLAHVILVLLLSLIAFSGQRDKDPLASLMVISESQVNITDAPTFELEPPAAPDFEPAAAEPVARIPLDLGPLPKFESEFSPQPLGTTAEEQNLAASSSETALAGLSQEALSIQRRVTEAGGRQGEVQFALAWKNINDVDLHVIAPSGERISHLHKRSACRGELDVDMNVRGESLEPVENVRWIRDAPWGRYTILVNLFRIHRARPGSRVYRGSEFQLLAQLGNESTLKDDIVNRAEQLAVFRFQYVPTHLPTAQRNQLLAQLRQVQGQEEARARPLLDRAKQTMDERGREALLNSIIVQYPHTDAAIEAMRLLGGNITKA